DIDRDLEAVGQELGYTALEKLLAAVGAGDLTHAKVLNRLEPPEKNPPQKLVDMGKDIYATVMRRRVSGVRIQGLDNMMVHYARCCEPIPGDEIVGLVTRGRGVSVHRVGCSNMGSADQERLIEVTWDVEADQIFLVKLTVTGIDRKGLLADLSDAIRSIGVNIRSGDFKSEAELAKAMLLIEVRNLNNLEKVLKAVGRVRGVQQVERYQIS
nr:bifunctional (p)ppGpp synthetase/guanosine-3',5'-bis(diphosphate) 3'-pyrophosphohydrolase [bacterium]